MTESSQDPAGEAGAMGESTLDRAAELGEKISWVMDGYTNQECLAALGATLEIILERGEKHRPGTGVTIWREFREVVDASLEALQP